MTDKLQKTENVAENVANEILQHLPQDFNKFIEENYDTSQQHRNGSQKGDLTSQWKKDELKLGEHYYYTTIFSPTVYIQNFTRDVIKLKDFKETVAEVLAPVPSYEQWKALNENMDSVMQTNQSVLQKLKDHEKICCCADNEVLRLENAELKQRLKDTQNANAELNKTIQHLSKTQARQFVDNQNLQVKAEKAKDVIDLDAARQIKQLKAKNDDFKKIIEYMIDELVDPNDDVSRGLAEYFSQDLINEIYEVLK